MKTSYFLGKLEEGRAMIIDINLDYLGFGIYGVALLSFTIWALINADKYGNE